jgi:hypothetical protein
MQRLLIHPPFADPTQPYVALPTLKGHLRSKGLDARVLDLNLESVHWLFAPERLDDLATRFGLRFLKLNHKSVLDFREQREYRLLLAARAKMETLLGADPPPLEVFRTRALFFDPAAYSLARRRVEAYFEILAATQFPFRIDLNRVEHEVLPWSFDLLEEYRRDGHSPLDGFYREVFDAPEDPGSFDPEASIVGGLDLHDTDFIGISIVFPSQIPEAVHLADFLRPRAPNAFIALGGPAIHRVVLSLEPLQLERLFALVDGIGIFEGEPALESLFPRLEAWRNASEPSSRADVLRGVPNLLSWDATARRPIRGAPVLLPLGEAAPPDYSDLDLDRYLAPSRTILYAPTRGCYWNRCSFCHYGLAEEGTAAYREIPPERAVAQLARLARLHGVRNVYLACDVLSPSWAIRFAEAVLARGLKIRWSTDLKIDGVFTPERCELLHRSGLRAAAFGVESGSDRMLELMKKGCDRKLITEVNRAFHSSGVATQWMAFTDHPGETVDEAVETARWIEEESESIDLFIVGEFGLEPGSDVALHPERYGVERIFHAAGDELGLHPLYISKDGTRSAADRERIEKAVRRAGASYALRPYPWAGAVSTHHSFLHFLEFSQGAMKSHFLQAGAENDAPLESPPLSHVPGLREYSRFDPEALERQEREFLEAYLPGALRPEGVGPQARAPLDAKHFEAAAAQVPPLRSGKNR